MRPKFVTRYDVSSCLEHRWVVDIVGRYRRLDCVLSAIKASPANCYLSNAVSVVSYCGHWLTSSVMYISVVKLSSIHQSFFRHCLFFSR